MPRYTRVRPTTREKFEALQSRAREARDAHRHYAAGVLRRYGATWYAPLATRRRLDVIQRASARRDATLYRWLATYSPRDWTRGCPVSYVLDTLTYDDALTSGALAIVPPPAWGGTEEDARRFAEPVAPWRQQ